VGVIGTVFGPIGFYHPLLAMRLLNIFRIATQIIICLGILILTKFFIEFITHKDPYNQGQSFGSWDRYVGYWEKLTMEAGFS